MVKARDVLLIQVEKNFQSLSEFDCGKNLRFNHLVFKNGFDLVKSNPDSLEYSEA